MKKVTLIIAIQSLFLLGAFGQTGFKTGIDYREQFTGRFEGLVYYYYLSMGEVYRDTTQVVIIVDKFLGYTVGGYNNYLDIEHKVGITYGKFSTTRDDSWCHPDRIVYYLKGYLHPTIDTTGVLTYPELKSCVGGFLNGFISRDSIKIFYGNSSQRESFNWRIVGVRKASGNEFIKLTGNEVNIYPIPARDYLNITGIDGKCKITISDVTGRMVKSKWLTENAVDVSSLKKGLYFITISTEKERITKKFIKE